MQPNSPSYCFGFSLFVYLYWIVPFTFLPTLCTLSLSPHYPSITRKNKTIHYLELEIMTNFSFFVYFDNKKIFIQFWLLLFIYYLYSFFLSHYNWHEEYISVKLHLIFQLIFFWVDGEWLLQVTWYMLPWLHLIHIKSQPLSYFYFTFCFFQFLASTNHNLQFLQGYAFLLVST